MQAGDRCRAGAAKAPVGYPFVRNKHEWAGGGKFFCLINIDLGVAKDGERMMHLDGVEELCDDGRYASEKGRAALAFHLVAEAFHLDKRPFLRAHFLADAGRIHFWD